MYNVEAYLQRCLDSVLQQDLTENDYEILLINDGSKDSTAEIAQKYASKNPQVHYFFQENRGLGGARNTGIQKASGKYVMFLDSDDWIEDRVLESLINRAESENLDLLIYDSQRVFPSGEIKKIEVSYEPEKIYSGEELLLNSRVDILPCANFYKKELLQNNNIEFVEGVFYEDPDFYLKCILNSQRILYVPTMVYDYFYNEQSITINAAQPHINKKINDYGRAALRIEDLKGNQKPEIQMKLNFIIEKYQLILMKMIYQNNVEFSMVDDLLKGFKKVEKYPFKIKQQWKNKEMNAQLFYFNTLMRKPYFFKKRFNGALFLMRLNKRIPLF